MFIAGGSASFPVWLRLSRRAGVVIGYTSADALSWTLVGSASAPTGGAFVGLAVTSHDTSARDRGSFARIRLWRLPSGWSQQDVGSVGRRGSATASDTGVFTVAGAGADIWGTSDAFDAVVQPLQGDATLLARVVNEEDTNMFAKAGLTFGALSSASARIILDTRPDGNVEFMARLADAAAMSFIGGASATFRLAQSPVQRSTEGAISRTVRADHGWRGHGALPVTIPAGPR
jgi:hypothetical protein